MIRKEPLFVQPVALDLAWNDPQENLRRIELAVKAGLSKSRGIPAESRIFLFPELTLTGFVTQKPSGWSIRPPDPAVKALQRIASKYNTALAVGFPELNPENIKRPFNVLSLIGPDGSVIAGYRKTHLFTAGKHPESAVYTGGKGGIICEYRGWRIGFAVCFDLRFPTLFHEYAKAGLDLLLVGSCWIGGPHKSEQYRTLNSAYAVLTQAYVASVNRSGKDPFYKYDGATYLFSPFGDDVYRREAYRLDPDVLDQCRKMIVRSADHASYTVRTLLRKEQDGLSRKVSPPVRYL